MEAKKIALILVFSIIPVLLISGSMLLFSDNKQDTTIQSNSEVDLQDFSEIQVPFIENQGQKNDIVKFYAKTFAGTIYVTDENLTYHSTIQKNDHIESMVLKEIFIDGNLEPKGESKSKTTINYFKGDKEDWRTNIPSYNEVSLGSTWKNIEVSLKAYQNNVEKIFTVLPEGNPQDIQLGFEDIQKLEVNDSKELVIHTETNNIKFSKPIAFQYVLGEKTPVDVDYTVKNNFYGFLVGEYRKDLPLVIDPLIASTFIGSDSNENEGTTAIDSHGNIFVTGIAFDSDYPTIVPTYDSTPNGADDIVISKFNSDLTELEASTFIGGDQNEKTPHIAIDSSDNVFIASATSSDNTTFPRVGPYQDQKAATDDDFIISKFNNNLSTLSASTFLGGIGDEDLSGILIDDSDNIFVIGNILQELFQLLE